MRLDLPALGRTRLVQVDRSKRALQRLHTLDFGLWGGPIRDMAGMLRRLATQRNLVMYAPGLANAVSRQFILVFVLCLSLTARGVPPINRIKEAACP